MPYEIYAERMVDSGGKDIRHDESHHALVWSDAGAVKVTLTQVGEWTDRQNPGVAIEVVEYGDDTEQYMRIPWDDLVESYGKLLKCAGIELPIGNFTQRQADDAAEVVLRAASALRSHPAHGMDELAAELQATMIGVIHSATHPTDSA
jgi:hypothetical protein